MGFVKCTNPDCRKSFAWSKRVPNKKYCCDFCRRHSLNLRRRKPPPPRKNCKICNQEFIPNKYHPVTQKVCFEAICRRKAKQLANRLWYLRNLHLFRSAGTRSFSEKFSDISTLEMNVKRSGPTDPQPPP